MCKSKKSDVATTFRLYSAQCNIALTRQDFFIQLSVRMFFRFLVWFYFVFFLLCFLLFFVFCFLFLFVCLFVFFPMQLVMLFVHVGKRSNKQIRKNSQKQLFTVVLQNRCSQYFVILAESFKNSFFIKHLLSVNYTFPKFYVVIEVFERLWEQN